MTFALAFMLQCFFPIFDWSSNEFLGLSVVNTAPQPQEFTVTVKSPEGRALQTGSLRVPAGGQRAGLLGEILGTSTGFASGWIQVDGFTSACPTYYLQGNSESLSGLEPAPIPGNSEVLLPHVEINTGFMELNHTETSIAVVNPSSGAADVSAGLFALNGTL